MTVYTTPPRSLPHGIDDHAILWIRSPEVFKLLETVIHSGCTPFSATAVPHTACLGIGAGFFTYRPTTAAGHGSSAARRRGGGAKGPPTATLRAARGRSKLGESSPWPRSKKKKIDGDTVDCFPGRRAPP